MADRLVPIDDNYLFPTPLESRLAAKMTASVTDSAVAGRVNGAQTGAAIDQRITTRATPLVQPIVADYIASSQVVVDAAAAAVDANPKIATLEAKNVSQDTAIVGATWRQGGMLATSPINGPLGSVKDGEYWATSDTRGAELGLPGGRAGKLTQASSGTYGFHVFESILGTYTRLWSAVGNSWGAWVNPANVYTDAAMNSVKWYHGGLAADAPINGALGSMADGTYRVTSGTRAEELELPGGAGKFTQVSFGTFGFHTYTSQEGISTRLWVDGSQAWGAWVTPTGGGGGTAPAASSEPGSGNKLVPLVLTVGHGGGAYGLTSSTVRFPMEWAAPIFRFRIHIRNINPRENTLRAGAVSFPQGLYLGTATAWDGTATALEQIVPPFSTPENADGWVSGWIEKELPPDSKHVLSGAYVASGTVTNNAGVCWTSPGQVANSTAGTWTKNNMSPLDFWIEAETPATVPVVAVVGDSLSSGTTSTMPVFDSALSQYMRAKGGLPIHYSHVGDTYVSFNGRGNPGSADYKRSRWLHLARPDSVLVALGSNDIFGNSAPIDTIKARLLAGLEWIKPDLSETVFLSTIPPRDLETGAKEDVRREYNAHLKTQTATGGVARAVFDLAAAVSADDETILPEFNGDGIHLNTAGYAAQAAVLKNLTSPAVMYRTV